MCTNKIVLSLLLLLCFGIVHTQQDNFVKRYLNKFINDTTDKEKPQFLLYPTAAYAPETSWEFGFSSIFVGYAKRDTNNRLSEINGFTFFTAKKQFGGFLEHALHSHKNTWFLLGKIKAQSFPLSYFGIGHDSPEEKLAHVESVSFTWKERILRKVYKDFFIGMEFDWQHLGDVEFVDHVEGSTYEKPFGHEGSTNIGLGIGLLYDNRHNVLNVRHGALGELAWISYRESFGSISNFNTIFSDFRYFIPIKKRNVLAIQGLGQFSIGAAPFNQLAMVGGEMMMRGFYYGRFRDKNYMSAQVEYRMLPLSFAKKFGFALFASGGIIYNNFSTLSNNHFKYSGGAGLHYLMFPKKDVWTRLDFAVNSEGGTGIYFFMGCAF